MTTPEQATDETAPHSMGTTDYAAALRILNDPKMPLMRRFHAARAASAYEDRVMLAAVDNPKVRFLDQRKENLRIRHYGKLAKIAQAWLAQMGEPMQHKDQG
jgi:hypothetical protein